MHVVRTRTGDLQAHGEHFTLYAYIQSIFNMILNIHFMIYVRFIALFLLITIYIFICCEHEWRTCTSWAPTFLYRPKHKSVGVGEKRKKREEEKPEHEVGNYTLHTHTQT